LITLIASILVFSIVVLVHEYGHYKAARSVGIKVEEFAIGMGPTIYKREKNGTIYSIRLLPIGGFVNMVGEDESVDSDESFMTKTVWQRFKVIVSGPLMNFLLAIVIYITMSLLYGVPGTTVDLIDTNSELYNAGVRTGDKIISVNDSKVYIRDDLVTGMTVEEKPYTIEVLREGKTLKYDVNQYYRYIIGIYPYDDKQSESSLIKISDNKLPAYKAGLREGDKIVKINGVDVTNYKEITELISSSKGESLDIVVERNSEQLPFSIVPQKELQIGFDTKIEKSIITGIVSSFYKTIYYVKLMFNFIGMLVTGRVGAESVGGPVMVISMIGDSAKLITTQGLYPLLNLLAFLSVNLGFMNLLPIPALDGSKIVFLFIEKLRGKKIPTEKEGFVHFIGFVLLISLMLFITYKDIMRLF
jgi:regulator of sigma E protease